ncbi:MAG: flagellar biosynthetic protein FliO [Pseudomonadota bacterium]
MTSDNGGRRPIQFKPEATNMDADESKVLITMVVLIVLAAAILYWLKKKYPSLSIATGTGSKLKVIETRPISPRLTLYLIDVKGEEILLAHSGDSVVQIKVDNHLASLLPRAADESHHPVG